jgi:hypothetical protein
VTVLKDWINEGQVAEHRESAAIAGDDLVGRKRGPTDNALAYTYREIQVKIDQSNQANRSASRSLEMSQGRLPQSNGWMGRRNSIAARTGNTGNGGMVDRTRMLSASNPTICRSLAPRHEASQFALSTASVAGGQRSGAVGCHGTRRQVFRRLQVARQAAGQYDSMITLAQGVADLISAARPRPASSARLSSTARLDVGIMVLETLR